MASGLLVDVLVLRARPSAGGVVLALIGLATGLALAFWPIRGRTGEQWLPLVVRWSWSALAGSRRQLAPGPSHGHLATVDPSRSSPGSSEVRPVEARFRSGVSRTVFDGLKVLGAPFGSESSTPELGIVVDSRARTATAALVVRGHSFALLGSSDQDGRIAGWARVLSSMAREGSEVHRVQWIESCLPDDGRAVRRHTAEHAVLGADSPAGSSYRAFVDEAAPVTRRHQVLVTLSIRTGRSSRAGRSSGGGTSGIGGVLAREVLSLHRALDGADVNVEGVLGPGALAREIGEASAALGDTAERVPTVGPDGIARSVDPSSGNRVACDRSGPVQRAERPSHWPWPMAVEPTWDAVRTDGTWHATYWIAEWPRVDVTPDFLGRSCSPHSGDRSA